MGTVVVSTKDRKKTFHFHSADVERWEKAAKGLGISLTALIERAMSGEIPAESPDEKPTRQLIEEIHAAVVEGEK